MLGCEFVLTKSLDSDSDKGDNSVSQPASRFFPNQRDISKGQLEVGADTV